MFFQTIEVAAPQGRVNDNGNQIEPRFLKIVSDWFKNKLSGLEKGYRQQKSDQGSYFRQEHQNPDQDFSYEQGQQKPDEELYFFQEHQRPNQDFSLEKVQQNQDQEFSFGEGQRSSEEEFNLGYQSKTPEPGFTIEWLDSEINPLQRKPLITLEPFEPGLSTGSLVPTGQLIQGVCYCSAQNIYQNDYKGSNGNTYGTKYGNTAPHKSGPVTIRLRQQKPNQTDNNNN